jgi:GGDEF domain-containing protein
MSEIIAMSELIFDELTGLMTPYHFYESAKRIKSWADRRGEALAIIAIRTPTISDDTFVEVSRTLNSELRGGDLLTRMSKQTFAILLLGDEKSADHLIFRLSNIIKPQLIYTRTYFDTNEELAAALERLGI